VEKERALRKAGWVKRFMADEPRLSEAVAEYLSLGCEVHLEAVDPKACASSQACRACFEDPGVAARFKVIFTRPGGTGKKIS